MRSQKHDQLKKCTTTAIDMAMEKRKLNNALPLDEEFQAMERGWESRVEGIWGRVQVTEYH